MADIRRGAEALSAAVRKQYEAGNDDYHLEPMARVSGGVPVGRIKDGDSVIFCCRRGEREIELTEMFTDDSFKAVPRRKLNDLYFAIMTLYHDKFHHLPVAYAPEHVKLPLAEVLSKAGKTQFHAAESEKYAHVTFFFNGGENSPFPGEDDFCEPSPKGIPFEEKPELSLPVVRDKVIDALGKYDFIVTNFANGDVIGHTQNDIAKVQASVFVSEALSKVVPAALEKGYVVCVTADHGNIEAMRTAKGTPHGAHTSNKVAFIMMDGQSSEKPVLHDGALSDVAPTILDVMGIEKPELMTGKSLVEGHDFGRDRKVLLIICDGWGIGEEDRWDAIHISNAEFWYKMIREESWAKLDASGEFVGLGAGKPGNSEAGHSNLGAGRTVMQDDIRLDTAVKDGSFLENPVFVEAIEHAKKTGGALHLLSYLTHKSSHGAIEYPLSILKIAKRLGLDRVYMHIIFDGRSTDPGSAPALLMETEKVMNEIGVGEIVDGVGRGIALDRDKNYDRVKKAYDNLLDGTGAQYE